MNILLITADQWRADCLSTLGHPCVRTPNLDRLARDGVLFERHFSNATPCGPARASIHTGLYACNHRSITNGTPLDARHRTLAGEFRRTGWDPVLFGYTDTSLDPRTLPPGDPGLHTYESVCPGFRALLQLPEHARPWLDHLEERGYGRLTREEAQAGPLGAPAHFRAEDSETAFLADRLLRWLERGQQAEWFAHISFLRPHPPWIAAQPWNSLVAPEETPRATRAASPEAEGRLHPWLKAHLERPFSGDIRFQALDRPSDLDPDTLATLRAVYYGLVAEVDHHIGRILDQLARFGELDRTLVIVTADHGEMLGDHWMLGKSGFFPQAFRVPLIIRTPEGGRGRRVRAFTEHVDLMPTLLDLAGIEVPLQCDGQSLRGFLQGEEPKGWRNAATYEHDFRDLVAQGYETILGIDSNDCQLAARFDERSLYVHFATLPPLCFDFAQDPGCSTNIAALPQAAPRVAEQAQAMLSWRMRAGERRLTGCAITAGGIVGRYEAGH